MSRCGTRLLLVAILGVLLHAEKVHVPTKRKGAGPLFQIARAGKWGFIDRTGRVVIAPTFYGERDFFHGLAAVLMPEEKWGFIDETGKLAIGARFDEVRDFLDDLAPVRIGRKWGYIDTSGRFVVEPQFQAVAEFHEGLARIHVWDKVVCSTGKFTSDDAPLRAFYLFEESPEDVPDCFPQGGKFGFIDKTGKIVIAPQFFVAQDFAEDLAAVRVEESEESKYGYIDRTGQMVIPPRFNQAGPFSEDLAAVETSARIVGDKVADIAWGFIDKRGALRIPDKYQFAGNFSEGLARVEIQSGVSNGYIDHSGKMVIPARFTEAWDFSEGLAAVCSDECVYINRSGKAVLKKYYAEWPFSDGLTVIARPPISYDDPKFYIDKKGRVIAPYSIEK